MEKIELRVERLAGADVASHWSAVFGVAGGTIGRGGQNKLVLPDADAGVARVHAMVRLESDAAYIANLCERRSMQVSGHEVQSGQEVQLHVGAEIQVGPYTLRAVAPGTSPAKVVAAPPKPVAPAAMSRSMVAEPSIETGYALASKPNSWTDIPQQMWSQGGSSAGTCLPNGAIQAEAPLLDKMLDSSLGSTTSSAIDDPFAMLGRLEAGVLPPPALTPDTPCGRETDAFAMRLQASASPPQAQIAAVRASTVTANVQRSALFPEAQSANVSTPAVPNVFDGEVTTARLAGVTPPDRPLLIPADFDPFARDLDKEAAAQDPWAGGLPHNSLSQVANIKSDELLRTLPLKGKLDDSLDNPAHSGLPKALDPMLETDPLLLFGSSAVADSSILASAEVARGPELAQSFYLPKSSDPGVLESQQGPSTAKPTTQPVAPSDTTVDAAMPSHSFSAESLGNLPPKGLDLAMFGGACGPMSTPANTAAAISKINADASRPTSCPEAIPVPTQVAKPTLAQLVEHERAAAFLSENKVRQVSVPGASQSVANAASHGSTLGLDLSQVPPTLPANAISQEQSAAASVLVSQRLMDAFLVGAGLAPDRVEAQMTPDFMRQFGEAFRVAVQGTIELLAARSEIKREFRADVTVIAPRANNPLKFLPNADGVVMQMVGQSFPGFMKPVPSMKEAFFDLQVHQLALMAGIRAAYAEALARFDPAEIEKRCESNSGLLSRVSTTARKAAVWDDYKQSYNAIRRHAEDDLVAFSGEAFVKAYDAAAQAARESP